MMNVIISVCLLLSGTVLWIVFAWLYISISAFYAAIQNTAGMSIAIYYINCFFCILPFNLTLRYKTFSFKQLQWCTLYTHPFH